MSASPFKFRLRTGLRLILSSSVILLMFGVLAALSLRNFQRLDEATSRVQALQAPLEAGLKMLGAAYKLFVAQTTLWMTDDMEQVDRFNETMRTIEENYYSTISAHIHSDEEKLWFDALKTSFQEYEDLFLGRLVPAAMNGDYDRVRSAHKASQQLLQTIEDLDTRLSQNFQGRIYDAAREQLEVTEQVRNQTAYFIVAAAVAALFTSWLLGLSIIRAINQLVEATRRVSAGDLSHPIELKRTDEFGLLAESFNDMTRRLRRHQQDLVQAGKLAAIGRIASGVAHEINNPIGVILGYTKVLASTVQDPDVLADIKTIEEEAMQCKKIVEGLLTIARPIDTGGHMPDVVGVLRDVLERVRLQRAQDNIQTTLEANPEVIPLDMDEARWRQIAMNLINNAYDAMPNGGVLSIRCSVSGEAENPMVVVEFADTGQGIKPEDMERLFEPFFTSKPKGTGLGLAVCHGIVSAYGGSIRVHGEPGKGARFIVQIPQRISSASGSDEGPSPS